MKAKIANLTLFKIVYALSLFGVAFGLSWLGAVGLLVFTIWHAKTSQTPVADFTVAFVALVLGLLLDSLYIQMGLLSYAAPYPFKDIAPFWILVLWVNFALTLNGCMQWMQQRYVVAMLFGAIGGPLSYMGGIALGAAERTGEFWLTFGTISVTWGIIVPTLAYAAERLGRDFVVTEAGIEGDKEAEPA